MTKASDVARGRDHLPIGPARPFLKWVGGKGQLLPALLERIALVGKISGYHEPFIGGGALFFALRAGGSLPEDRVFLSDTNPNLLDAYLGVRDAVDEVIARLLSHKAKHGEEHYYAQRAAVPRHVAGRAARIIYLNKTCYNGLYRENSKGGFNVPMGRYKNPGICDEENLRAASAALQGVNIARRDFRTVLDHAKKGDLVYFDPPYWPVSATSSFTAYAKDNFGEQDQRDLAAVFSALAKRGVKVLLSNSDTPFVRELYRDFPIDTVLATRNVNSRADRRGKVNEVLVRSFGPAQKKAK